MKTRLQITGRGAIASPSIFGNKIERVMISKKELSDRTTLSISYINKLMRLGIIPFVKIGRRVLFVLSEVIAALKQRSTA